jgi:hypothetical protein
MSEEFNKIEGLAERLKAYLNTRLSQVKLSAAEKTAKVSSVLIALLLAALVFFLFLTILSVGIALLIGEWLGSYWLGFMIMSGIILVLGGWGWLTRDRWLRIPIMNMLIGILFNEEDHEKD